MDNKENKTNQDSKSNKDLESQNEEIDTIEYYNQEHPDYFNQPTLGLTGFMLKTDNGPSGKKKP